MIATVTVLIWKVTLDMAPAHVHLFVCTRAWGLLTVAQAKTISLLVGSAPKAPRKFWDI